MMDAQITPRYASGRRCPDLELTRLIGHFTVVVG
jgi:hypothetical protein